MTEAELISRCRKDDRMAQEELFHSYAGKMMGICLRYTRNKDDARDLLHDGFIKVLTHIKGFKEESALTTWMSRIFVNTALTHLKSNYKKYIHLEPGDEMAEDFEDELPDKLAEELSSEEVLEMVQMLPDKYRIIINLYCVDGFTHRMISEQLGISEGTSKSQLSRGRQLLSKMVEQHLKKNEKAGK
jgi:RNA polymerase sigma factor (sigma-70 family)